MPVITVWGPNGTCVAYRFDRIAVTIGRSAVNDLLVRDPALSRVHAEIRQASDGWVIVDRDSRNGTSLNGRRVQGSASIVDGDRIALGRTILVFSAGDAVPRSKPAPGETEDIGWSSRGTASDDEAPTVVGVSPVIRTMLDRIERIAASSAAVLITGENGTGKELVARLIHRRSSRRDGPFVAVNCPGLPGSLLESELFGVERGVATGVDPRPGRFEQADGGTLLLDEIGDMEPVAQGKILRALQERRIDRVGGREPIPVDVRVLAATNHDLEADIAGGLFRRDLYHRLRVFDLELPPLRARREDIPVLVAHFLAVPGERRIGIGPEALRLLESYDFPGNVRELEHVLERARVLADGPEIRPEDLPDDIRRRDTESAPGDPEDLARAIYHRIVTEGCSFWDEVQGPFLARDVSKETVRALIARGHEQAGRSYKKLARLFGIERDHKKLLNFLRNHRLRPGD